MPGAEQSCLCSPPARSPLCRAGTQKGGHSLQVRVGATSRGHPDGPSPRLASLARFGPAPILAVRLGGISWRRGGSEPSHLRLSLGLGLGVAEIWGPLRAPCSLPAKPSERAVEGGCPLATLRLAGARSVALGLQRGVLVEREWQGIGPITPRLLPSPLLSRAFPGSPCQAEWTFPTAMASLTAFS